MEFPLVGNLQHNMEMVVWAHVISSLETLFDGPDLNYNQREVIKGETSVARCLSYPNEKWGRVPCYLQHSNWSCEYNCLLYIIGFIIVYICVHL